MCPSLDNFPKSPIESFPPWSHWYTPYMLFLPEWKLNPSLTSTCIYWCLCPTPCTSAQQREHECLAQCLAMAAAHNIVFPFAPSSRYLLWTVKWVTIEFLLQPVCVLHDYILRVYPLGGAFLVKRLFTDVVKPVLWTFCHPINICDDDDSWFLLNELI